MQILIASIDWEPTVSGPRMDKPYGKHLNQRLLIDFPNERTEEGSEPTVSKVPNDMPDTRYGNSGKIAAQHNVIMYSYSSIIYNYIDL